MIFLDYKRPLVVLTTVTRWDELPRMRHQVTRQLARFYNVLYVQLFAAKDPIKVSENLIVCGVGKFFKGLQRLFFLIPQLEICYKRKVASKIGEYVSSLNYKEIQLVNFQFDFPELYDILFIRQSVFILNDEFIDRQVQLRESERGHLLQRQRDVLRKSDSVLAVSYPLLARVRNLGYQAEIFFPGVELPRSGLFSPPPEAFKGSRPIKVCFMGYVNARLNIDWLAMLASQNDFEVSLIGPVDGAIKKELSSTSKIKVLPAVEGSKLFSVLAEYHVFVIPYKIDAGVRACTVPNKFFQYLAVGRPVVISDMPHFIQTRERFTYRATNAKTFMEKIYEATREDNSELHQARMAFAQANSWDSKGDFLHALLERLHQRRR